MSSGDGDRVQVVGSPDDSPSPPRRSPSGLVLLAVGLIVGSALGGLLSRSDPDPLVTSTTEPSVISATTTATTEPVTTADEYQDQIDDLEFLLEAAQQKVYELGLVAEPVEYAPVVGCDARQQVVGTQLTTFLESYFVGSVGFWFPSQDLSGEEHEFLEVWAVVETGDSVTMVVPSGERDRYSLLWNPATWRGTNSVADGEPAVTLTACEEFPTFYIGGFAVEQNYCAPLDVFFGHDPEPEHIIIPFGIVDCPAGTTPLVLPEAGPVPDVTGMTLREARLAIRLAAFVPVVNDDDPIDPVGMVWGQKPSGGETPESGAVIGLRTCQPADQVVATYQERLNGTGVTLSEAWMVPSNDPSLESWYFVSALVSGGPTDGQTATWALPAFDPETSGVDPLNTPNLSFPVNDVSEGFGFGDRRFTPGDYNVADWLDLDGAIASQRCVQKASQDR